MKMWSLFDLWPVGCGEDQLGVDCNFLPAV